MISNTVAKMVSDQDMSQCRKAKGLKVLIASRYRPGSPVKCTYSVIGFYISEILKCCGADIVYRHIRPSGHMDKPLRQGCDLAILCYYDTDYMLRGLGRFCRSLYTKCGIAAHYGNVVSAIPNLAAYFVSREAYLDPGDPHYRMRCYSRPRSENFSRAIFAGRGADYRLLKPKQEGFKVLVDGSAGVSPERHVKDARKVSSFLEANGYKVVRLGFDPKSTMPKRGIPYQKVAKIYRSTNVYVCGIRGLYELPVLETQCAGNYVISWRGILHKDLLDPKSSQECSEMPKLVEAIEKVKESYDPSIPRRFVLDGFRWTDVCNRIMSGLLK